MIDKKLLDALSGAKRRHADACGRLTAAEDEVKRARTDQLKAHEAYQKALNAVRDAA